MSITQLADGTWIDSEIAGTPDPISGIIRTGRVIMSSGSKDMGRSSPEVQQKIKAAQAEAQIRRQKYELLKLKGFK